MVVSLAALFNAQAGRCWYCAEPMHQSQGRGHSTTRDHLLPKSRGGANARSNIVGACGRCNALKGDMTESEFRRAFPTAAACERAWPMARFDRVVRANWRPPANQKPVTVPRLRWPGPTPAGLQIDHEAAWRDLQARFPPRPPPRPVGFCAGCRFFAGFAPGHPPVCQWRWQRGDWGSATPLTSAADSCHEHAAR